jgi:hypothetical protein
MLVRFSSTHAVDAARVFVTGVSSGGAMAGVLLATYPELFSAGALFAGVPYHCSTSLAESFGCMTSATTHSATQWGDLVRNASTHTAPWPRVSIWHGTADHTVAPVNAEEEVLQWTNVHGLPLTPTSTETQGIDSIKRYADVGNVVRVEQHLLAGMDHGTPVDPGSGAQQCGTATTYLLDVNLCSARAVAAFFGLTATSPSLDASVALDAAVSTPDAAIPGQDAGTSGSASSGQSDVGTIPACTCQEGGRAGGPVPGLALVTLLWWARRQKPAQQQGRRAGVSKLPLSD